MEEVLTFPCGKIEDIDGLKNTIGNTPMVEIRCHYKGKQRRLFAKCEFYNLTGSIKDRVALYTLEQAYRNDKIQPSDTIVEATSGNMGISYAAVGRALGHRVRIIMPDWLSLERRAIIKSFGADITLVSKAEGGFLGSIALSQKMFEEGGVFLPRQFDNTDNCKAHETTTGPEIWEQLASIGIEPDAFIAGVGTGGTVMGVGRYLRTQNRNIKIYPLEPAESPTLSTGHKIGSHRIQGISDEFIPSILQLDRLDDIVGVQDGDAIIMAQKLASELGIAVGISSGANFIGALKVMETLGDDAVVVTTFADCNKKYLSTDLVKEEPTKEGYLSNDVVLDSFQALHRL
ncbi:MAG: cysteine synthase family protein [Chitinophagaceae bacterium]